MHAHPFAPTRGRRRTGARRLAAPRAAACVAAAALALAPDAPGAQLSPVERRIARAAGARTEEAVAFLERVVNVNSGTLNVEGVREVGRLFADELRALGFETRWIPMDPVNRAGHLLAERRGGRGPRILLLGHLDTVFEKDHPFQRFAREDTIAYGPGVDDMKGGCVVLLYALRALHDAGALRDLDIVVLLTGDEEDAGRPTEVSRAPMVEAARRSDVVLGFEGMVGGLNTATIARRGISGWTLTVRGREGHSSQIFTEPYGAGAVFEAARILNAFYDELRGEADLTVNPGLLVGGTQAELDAEAQRGTALGKTNVIAQTVVVAGDLRFLHAEEEARARERMREIVARNLPGTRAEIVFEDGYPAMSPKPENEALRLRLDRVSRDLGLGPVEPLDPRRRGAGDIAFVAHMRPALDGLGPLGGGAHSAEEWIDLRSIPIAVKRAAVLLHRLARRPDATN
jgi:glutamate carboxypeptidase